MVENVQFFAETEMHKSTLARMEVKVHYILQRFVFQVYIFRFVNESMCNINLLPPCNSWVNHLRNQEASNPSSGSQTQNPAVVKLK